MQDQVLDISPIVVWAIAISQLLTAGLTIWGLMSSGNRANAKKLEDHGKRLDGHELRLAGVEQSMEESPTKDDLAKVLLSLETMRGDIRVMRSEMEGAMAIMSRLESIVSRHENHLLGSGRSQR